MVRAVDRTGGGAEATASATVEALLAGVQQSLLLALSQLPVRVSSATQRRQRREVRTRRPAPA